MPLPNEVPSTNEQVDDGGPAFPIPIAAIEYEGEPRVYNSAWETGCVGMTLRAYAAIKLGVPESGIDWLDAMIVKSNRDRFAGQIACGLDRCWELFTRLGEARVYERHRLVADHGAEVVFVGKLPGDCSPLSGGIA